MYDDSDFTSEDMCCACGGGDGTQVPTPAPTFVPQNNTTLTSTTEISSSTETTTIMVTATVTTTERATSTVATTASATTTDEYTEPVAYTAEYIANATDMAALQLIASNLSSITTTIGGLEVTVVKASVDDAVDGFLSLPDVSAATAVDISLPTSLFDALGVESALVVAANIPALAVPTGAAGTQVEGTISISVKSDTNASSLSVTGLADPILIDLPNVSGGLVCGYFDEDTLEWTSEGITTAPGADGTLRCATTHLTVFGAILKGFLSALECSQASLLSTESYEELWAGDWSDSLGSVPLFGVIFIYFAMLLTAHAYDVRDERAGLWGTREFLVPEFVAPEVLDGGPMTPVVSDHAVPAAPSEVSPADAATELERKGSRKGTNGTVSAAEGSRAGTNGSVGAAVAKTVSRVSDGANEAVSEGAKESCEEMLQNMIVEVFSAVTSCVGGAKQAVEAFVVFAWEFLRGDVKLSDVRKMVAARNARRQVSASLLMHSDDLDFLLSDEVWKELEVPAPDELDEGGAPLRTLAGTAAGVLRGDAAERGRGGLQRRHQLRRGRQAGDGGVRGLRVGVPQGGRQDVRCPQDGGRQEREAPGVRVPAYAQR
jgi:hypothetical protein